MTTTRWAVVLAGGTGVRLAEISVDEAGLFVPKQYCALDGERLVEAAIRRAESVVGADRVLVVVAEEHRSFWQPLFGADDPRLVVQPHRRGSAPAALLGILAVLDRDPGAQVVLMPADQTVLDERSLTGAIRDAQRLCRRDTEAVALIGARADYVTSDYGWLTVDARGATRLVEKPGLIRAIELFESGASWSTGIAVASGATWLAAFERALPGWVEALTAGLACNDGPYRQLVLEHYFASMLDADLGAVFTAVDERLRCVRRTVDGWADLESARAVAPFVGRLEHQAAGVAAR